MKWELKLDKKTLIIDGTTYVLKDIISIYTLRDKIKNHGSVVLEDNTILSF